METIKISKKVFHTSGMSEKELMRIIRSAISNEFGKKTAIRGIDYVEDGVNVTLDSGEVVFVEIDWEEIRIIRSIR